MRNPLIPKIDKPLDAGNTHKSMGILDDYKTAKVMTTKELYLAGGTTGQFLQLANSTTGATQWATATGTDSTARVGSISVVFEGGGAVLAANSKLDLSIPFACTINSATLLADQSGSVVVDVWKDTLANYPPTVADTITASAKPTLSSADHGTDTTLTGWTTSISAGDTLRFNVDSATTITRVTLSLKVTKT